MRVAAILAVLYAAPAAAYALASARPTAQPRAGLITAKLPELYVYDHCPFCVRVRLALGVKGIPHKLVSAGSRTRASRTHTPPTTRTPV